MKRIWTIILLASAVRAADVTLWMTGQAIVDNPLRYTATRQASRMFAGIGVSLEWEKAMPTTPEGVVIEVRFAAGLAGHPGSMAFSTPFDSKPAITVLCDRILLSTERVSPGDRATVFAYVLAHELGHVLMRSNQHSPDGMMKAHWTTSDLVRITHRSLAFLPIDQDAIRRGIASFEAQRARRLGANEVNSGAAPASSPPKLASESANRK